MKIGLGTTVLTKSSRSGQADGIAVYTQELINELEPLAIDIACYDFIAEQGLTNLGKFPPQVLLSAATGLPFFQAKLTGKIDLFHATDHHIPKLSKIPVIATIMDPIPLAHPEWVNGNFRYLKNRLFKHSAKWAEHIITISDFSAEQISEHFDVNRDKITSIPLGVRASDYKKIIASEREYLLERYKLPKNYFICIGTLQPRKNIERLIDAFLMLTIDMQNAYPLVIIGRAGWQCDELVKRMHALSIDKSIYWFHDVPIADKNRLLQSSFALVFPSLYEGFGLPILEAFIAETPVITSNITALPEVAGNAAILIDPYSIIGIAEAMKALIDDDALRQELIIKGKQRVKKFMWKKTAIDTLEVYKKFV